MLKILTIIGARPQFIKASAISGVIQESYKDSIEEVLLHTGQHYDSNMSQIFFDDLGIPKPHYNLAISGGNHGEMTGRMLEGIEKVVLKEKPDWILIYGDTNSTLAGALVGAKLHIPVAHVEAGLRSYNIRMPEEVNRIVADKLSTLLLCPTQDAVRNLSKEGIAEGVHVVGDVMYDAALKTQARTLNIKPDVLAKYGITDKSFVLATCHRAENTDDPKRLNNICKAIAEIAKTMDVLLPLHPRTQGALQTQNLLSSLSDVKLVEPLSFLDMVVLEQAAKVILTDSGGVQKEAFFYDTPCVTMRDETEWNETVTLGWNKLAGADAKAICSHVLDAKSGKSGKCPYGNGKASHIIIEKILQNT